MSKKLGIKKDTIKSRATGQAGLPARPPRQNVTDLTKYRRSTYYLKPETAQALKILAIKRGVELTVLVRGILEKYIDRQRDGE